jgi:NAD(P)-dependent dehydrogenase (short-subunit alcohol dehydrogenase family)
MTSSIPHGGRSTANQVLAGVDLTRKWILITGCDEEIGFETMNALAANGAHVFGLASSLASAKSACDEIGPRATPVECEFREQQELLTAAAEEPIASRKYSTSNAARVTCTYSPVKTMNLLRSSILASSAQRAACAGPALQRSGRGWQ